MAAAANFYRFASFSAAGRCSTCRHRDALSTRVPRPPRNVLIQIKTCLERLIRTFAKLKPGARIFERSPREGWPGHEDDTSAVFTKLATERE